MKTSTKTVISINNISKVYEGPPPVRAIDGVSLEIKEGDLILFTPDTKHLVPRAKEEHEGYRISLAFNVEVTRPFIPDGTHDD